MNTMDILIILSLLVLLGLLVALVIKRLPTVEQGHVAVVQSFDRFSRMVKPGLYFLWPWEEEIAEIRVAQRVVSGLEIPGIFTKGGLSVGVLLSYEMRLDPAQMKVDELYYSDQDREDQQIRIFRRILQEVVADAPAPPPSADPNSVDTLSLFSPLIGPAGKEVAAKLAQRATGELAQRGFILTPETLVSQLKPPEAIISALTELRRSNFTSAARHEFIRRVRDAGGNMSDAALVQLLNAIQENPGNIHSIFTSGNLQPDVRVQDDNLSVRMGAGGVPATGADSAVPNPGQPSTTATQPSAQPPASPPANDDLPLTEEDMATLRSLFD